MRDETLAIHGGYASESTRAAAVPIYQTVAHDFESAEQAGAIMDLQAPGFHYNRINNPTVDVLERRIAALEGGVAAMATSSGMAAISQAVLNVCFAGDNLVTTAQLYGGTYTYFAHVLPRLGIEVRFAAGDGAEAIGALIDARTKAVFCESVGNPAGNVIDLEAVAAVADQHGVLLIVDNTVPTPLLLKPIGHGADVVVHSLTKFIGGHGTTLGGIVVDGGRFHWLERRQRYPRFCDPEPAFHGVRYAHDFPEAAFITRCRTVGMRNTGSSLAPFNAFLHLQGLETLAVRLERQEANARSVAAFLAADRRVDWVSFLGFAENPHHLLARRYLGDRVPSIITFAVRGGQDTGIQVYNRVRLFKRLLNMGDAKSLIAHPASTTHRQLRPEELARAGITPELLRLSIGLEHPQDLIEDLGQALEVAGSGLPGTSAATRRRAPEPE